MFNRLFSALENTRASISQAFKGISAGNITTEQRARHVIVAGVVNMVIKQDNYIGRTHARIVR